MQDIATDHKDQDQPAGVVVQLPDPALRAQRRALRAAAAAEARYLMSVSGR